MDSLIDSPPKTHTSSALPLEPLVYVATSPFSATKSPSLTTAYVPLCSFPEQVALNNSLKDGFDGAEEGAVDRISSSQTLNRIEDDQMLHLDLISCSESTNKASPGHGNPVSFNNSITPSSQRDNATLCSATQAVPVHSKDKESSPPHKILALSQANVMPLSESIQDRSGFPNDRHSVLVDPQLSNGVAHPTRGSQPEFSTDLPKNQFLVIPLDENSVPPLKGDFPSRNSVLLGESLLNLHLCLGASSEPTVEEMTRVIKNLNLTLKNADDGERHLLVSQLISKEAKLIARLVCAIERCVDHQVVGLVCEFLHDCLSPATKGNIRHLLIGSLVRLNTAEVLFRVFKSLSNAWFSKGDCGIIYGFQVIAKLASKDPKLAVKCRLVGGVKFTHQMIQAHSKNMALLHPLLLVLKLLAKNPTNQVVLGKDGCVATLISLLNSVPKNHWAKIKLILENLALLTKTTSVSPRLAATIRAGDQKIQALLNYFFESNVIRLVRENGLLKILSILECWEKIEKRQQLKVLKALLNVLSHLCDSKHGRKALCNSNGVDILHRFILACPSETRFEPLLDGALNAFLKCASKGELPVTSRKGSVTFTPPSRDSSPHFNQDNRELTPDRDQESSDEEDVIEEEDDATFDLKGIDLATVYNAETTRIDDLLKMSIFFPELQNQHVGLSRKLPVNTTKKGNADRLDAGDLYLTVSSQIKSLINFVKVAYPDMVGAEGPSMLEPLCLNNAKVHREKALRTVDRVLNPTSYQERVVFDLDYLLESEQAHKLISSTEVPCARNLINLDEKRIDKKEASTNHLNFESRFESGNLRRAIQVAPYEYDLLLNADVNSWHHHQWFYFEVSNMEAGIPYILNIINNEKSNSEFNFGMMPVIFSVKESQMGNSSWVRIGSDICYHKNHYVRFPKSCENSKFRKMSGKSYYTATMTIKFPHTNDVTYLAYHYPYTYTKLQTFLTTLDTLPYSSEIYYSNQILCQTLNGNPVPLLTITSNTKKSQDKEVIFLTARVHPGESNSSWVIHGTIMELLGNSDEAQALRNAFIFKIVPMLNPEGVIHGNQRCGLTDEDLNRRWRSPSPSRHPTIYYTKALIEHLTAVVGKRPRIFCDFHGHSRQKNVFMYGCSRQQSWWPTDKDATDGEDVTLLPRLAQRHMSTFSLRDCRFQVERAKESTARVAVWRQFNVTHSFTMEASTCGCDSGPYKNHHLSPKLLLETGEGFCKALYQFGCQDSATHKSSNFNRSSWILASNSDQESECEKYEANENYMDSDTELDYDLYGAFSST